MNPSDDLHRRALQICMEVIDLAPDAQQVAIDRLVNGDSALRTLVNRLVLSAADAEARLPTAGGLMMPATDLSGRQYGGYTLVHLIGHGGMGSVYLAERHLGEVQQRVAVKVMSYAAASAADVQRFAAEQQALARLHHPYIATFIDAGVEAGVDSGVDAEAAPDSDGSSVPGQHVPFLVMEYVPGESITDWCRREQSPIATRVELWLKLCDAVAYAHRNLIVHRDIKPANVLVTPEGLPKLLDFGVAKLLDAGAGGQTTRFARHLTLDYATPERILRNSVSTSDDVYALAALLHELLSGHRPFNRGTQTLENLLEVLEHEQAPPLAELWSNLDPQSRAKLAAERGLSERALQAVLGGDLSAVCARGLHADPARRYASVESMAADVRAWMRGEPVSAMGDSAWYRLSRFLRRRRSAVAAAAVSICALIAALGVYVVQSSATAREAKRAIAVNAFLEELLAAPNARWDTQWRGHADLRMSELLELASSKLEASLMDEPEVRVRLLGSLARSWSALSLHERAVEEQRKALAIVKAELPEDSPLRPRVSTTMATMLDYLRTPASIAEARTHLLEALDWFARYRPGASFDKAATLGELGYSHHIAGEFAEALRIYTETERMFLDSGGDPDHPLRALGVGLIGLAMLDDRQWQASRGELERSFALYQHEGNRGLTDAVYVYAGLILHAVVDGDFRKAGELGKRVESLSEATSGAASLDHFHTLVAVAYAHCEASEEERCEHYLGEAERVFREGGFESANDEAAVDLLRAEQLVRRGEFERALRALQRRSSLSSVLKVRSGAGFNVAGRWHLAMASALRGVGDKEEAGRQLEAGLAITRAIVGSEAPILGRLRERFDRIPVGADTDSAS